MKKEHKPLYKDVYGENYVEVDNRELNTIPATRQPRSTFEGVKEFSFLSGDFAIIAEKYENSKNDVLSFVVLVEGKPQRFYVSWLASMGFETYGEAPTKEDCKRQDEPVKGTSTANEGTLITEWRKCKFLSDAKKKFAGCKVKVDVIGYYHDLFSKDRPKPKFRFTLLKLPSEGLFGDCTIPNIVEPQGQKASATANVASRNLVHPINAKVHTFRWCTD